MLGFTFCYFLFSKILPPIKILKSIRNSSIVLKSYSIKIANIFGCRYHDPQIEVTQITSLITIFYKILVRDDNHNVSYHIDTEGVGCYVRKPMNQMDRHQLEYYLDGRRRLPCELIFRNKPGEDPVREDYVTHLRKKMDDFTRMFGLISELRATAWRIVVIYTNKKLERVFMSQEI